ncbi:EpsI family protein [Pseudoduganella sp. LjRoot289]|uniref:exosortase-associated protein EpsI, B-type n=1 Tax=Pseudoduganella sp. LjRoot289 TaxID=3342314 RepID=UPI003ECE05B3
MKRRTAAAAVLATLMGGTSAAAALLKPKKHEGPAMEKLGLESLIPAEFNGWHIDHSVVPVQPPPEVEEMVGKLYDETLGRTYVNALGQRVMLSIAYGGDQTGRLRVHRPEKCYSAQGFRVDKVAQQQRRVGGANVTVNRLYAALGARHEPITYWIRVGDETVSGTLAQRLTQLRFSLNGQIPDGLLFRVSSIGPDRDAGYALQDVFIADLVQAMAPRDAAKLVGSPARPPAAQGG